MIKCGKAEKVIVVASDCPDIFKCLWFDELGMYPKDGRIKPFSQRADGFILGEGAIAVVLENYDLARKRDVRVYGEYIAGSFKLESWKVTVPNPLQNCLADTISDVVQRSEMDIRDLDLICAHGVGTKINDTYEAKAIHTNIIEHRDVPVAAFKPYLGHTLGASALLEFAVLLLCMREQTILPILNVDATDQNSYLNLVRYKSQRKIKFALKTCCAFAGYNAATIIKNLEV
jgi:3-oxoacyl-(acyl-carrier-protein) synthase